MAKTKPFDMNAEQYEAWFDKNRYAYESELLAVKKALPVNGSGVEIGVGSGRFASPLNIVFGVEPSKKMRRLAIERGINVVDGTAEAIPFTDNSFDFCLLVTTICFLDDPEKAFKEVYRIIKQEGSVIIGFVDKDSPIGRSYQQYKSSSVFYREAVFYTTDDVVLYLKQAGFTGFCFYQTIFKPLYEIKQVEPVLPGYGRGSFIVIKAKK